MFQLVEGYYVQTFALLHDVSVVAVLSSSTFLSSTFISEPERKTQGMSSIQF